MHDICYEKTVGIMSVHFKHIFLRMLKYVIIFPLIDFSQRSILFKTFISYFKSRRSLVPYYVAAFCFKKFNLLWLNISCTISNNYLDTYYTKK